MTRAPSVDASRVKLSCLGVVLVGCAAGALGGRTDMSVMLAVLGVGLFVGLAMVPMAQLSAGVGIPRRLAWLLLSQSVAIDVFVLIQPVDAGSRPGTVVSLLGLAGRHDVGSTTAYQAVALVALTWAISSLLAAMVYTRRLVRQPGWVRPPAEPIGFYAEGRDRRDRLD